MASPAPEPAVHRLLATHLALDEALLVEAEEGAGELLRFWEWPAPAVIVGAGGKIAEEVDEAACRRDMVPILRRSSGGGAVLLGPGCLLFSLVLSFERDPLLAQVSSSYRYILDRIAHALNLLAPGLGHAGTSDLAWNGRKVSGNSQQRKRRHLLHHGTLLYAFDAAPLPRYLRPPPRQPEYRQGREHVDFIANLPAQRGDIED
ncbi:MAG: lipoate--protein ligase family protein, partial [Gemmataceae bacterium]